MFKEKSDRNEYLKDYNLGHYARVGFRAAPEEVEEIKRRASLSGKSLARFIVDRCLSPAPDEEKEGEPRA